MPPVADIDVCWVVSMISKCADSCCFKGVLGGKSYLLIKCVVSCCYRCVLKVRVIFS